MEDTRQSAPNMEEIDLLKLAKSVWRKRAFILKAAAVGAVVGVVVAFSIPREYTTTVKMAPEGVKTSAAGGMADLAAMAGINLGGQNQSGDGINLMLYPDIVSSTPFIVEMSQIPVRGKEMPSPVSLYDYVDQELSAPWWSHVVGAPMRLIGWIFSSEDGDAAEALNPYALSREQSLVLNALQHRIAISVDKKTGVITATATMQDPLVAAQAADSMVGKLEAYMSEYRTEKAKRDLAFTQNLFDEARQQYYEAQQRYARAVDANRNIARQSAQVELDRLQNEQQLAFGVYSQLAQQLENAKIKVQEQMPCVTIIEPASVPVNRSNMGKPVILFIFVFLGLMAGTGYVVIKELFFQSAGMPQPLSVTSTATCSVSVQ